MQTHRKKKEVAVADLAAMVQREFLEVTERLGRLERTVETCQGPLRADLERGFGILSDGLGLVLLEVRSLAMGRCARRRRGGNVA